MQTRRVVVLLFDEVEVLDFAVPFEVFSVAGRRNGLHLFDVSVVGTRDGTIRARKGLQVTPRCAIGDCREADVLVVPGGYGTRAELENAETVDWLRRIAPTCELVLSVCSGALLLAAAGLLRGLPATTHRGAFRELADIEPRCTVVTQRVVDTGKIVTTAGVSAALDGALHVLERLTNREIAVECAEYIEYDWRPHAAGQVRTSRRLALPDAIGT